MKVTVSLDDNEVEDFMASTCAVQDIRSFVLAFENKLRIHDDFKKIREDYSELKTKYFSKYMFCEGGTFEQR